MIARITIDKDFTVAVDFSKPIDISIPLQFDGPNPLCYYASPPVSEVIRSGEFIGSVAEGGTVNHREVSFIPHGNGTHTECYGHIDKSASSINQNLAQFNHLAQLYSATPVEQENGDHVIGTEILAELSDKPITALIIRTLPNSESKLTRNYSGTNPPYLSAALMESLVEKGIEHLLVDLPSVDKENDNGKLAGHKAFFLPKGKIRKNATITELIFAPDQLADNLYFLQLSIPSFELDAAPSKPIIYSLE